MGASVSARTPTIPDLDIADFWLFLRPTVEFHDGSEHAIRRILSDDGDWLEYETFCGQPVLSNHRAAKTLRVTWPWDGESYSGCEACLEGVLAAEPLNWHPWPSVPRLLRMLAASS